MLATSVPLLAPPRDVGAANKSWVGTSGNWTTTTNWAPVGMPISDDNVLIGRNDSLNRTVNFNLDTNLFIRYGQVALHPMGAGSVLLNQTGPNFRCATLSMGGTVGEAAFQAGPGTSASVGFVVFGAISRMNLTGGAQFRADDVQQFAGALSVVNDGSLFTVDRNYLFNGGTVNGPFRNNGTVTFNAATFGGLLDNHGTLALTQPLTTFTSNVTNHTPHTLAANRSIAVGASFTQAAGTFTQFGHVAVPGTNSQAVVVGGPDGATWDQVNATHTGNFIRVGSDGPGTYLLRGNSTITLGRQITIGGAGDGTFTHDGGRVTAKGLSIGSTSPVRARYQLNVGTMLIDGTASIGGSESLDTFAQTGGHATMTTLHMDLFGLSNLRPRLDVSGGSLTVAGDVINNGSILLHGTATMSSGEIAGTGSLTVTATSTLTAFRIRQSDVFVGRSGRILAAPGLIPPPHRVESLTFEPRPGGGFFGQWDLRRASLIIDYADAPGASPIATVRQYLASGFAGGSWNGNGLITTAPVIDPQQRPALGFAEAADVVGAAGGTFGGSFVDGTSVLIRFTRFGDANLDGTVNLQDFNRLAGIFGATGRIWSQGDFNYDGSVNLQDFNLLAGNFGLSASGSEVSPDDWAMLASAVPEPSAALGGVAASAAMCGCGRRRRRRAPT
jgi:hypothetical protein